LVAPPPPRRPGSPPQAWLRTCSADGAAVCRSGPRVPRLELVVPARCTCYTSPPRAPGPARNGRNGTETSTTYRHGGRPELVRTPGPTHVGRSLTAFSAGAHAT